MAGSVSQGLYDNQRYSPWEADICCRKGLLVIYLWTILTAVAVAGGICFSRKKFLTLPCRGMHFWLELAGALVAGGVIGWLGWLRVDGNPLSCLRLLLAAGAVAGAARCDIKNRTIPNLYPAIVLAGFVLCTGLDIVWQHAQWTALLGGMLGGAVVFVFLRLCSRLSHGGIGGGDIKLISALTCLIGLYGGFSVLLFAQLSAVALVLVLLALRRITMKSSIAFAPFFYLGLLITVFLGSF